MHPPQDEIPYVSNKETPGQLTLLHDALDLATVRVPRELEAASGAVSEMKAIAVNDVAGHVASEINNAVNPTTLIDSQVSLLLNTLSKFNDVVTNIASV